MVMDNRSVLAAPVGANNTNLPNTGYNTVLPEGAVWGLTDTGRYVQPGDGLTLFESGTVAPIDAAWGTSLSNNNTAGASALLASAVVSPAATYAQVSAEAAVRLSSTRLARVYSGDGATVDTNLNLQISSYTGANIVPPVVVTTDTQVARVSIHALASQRVLIIWLTAGNTLKFAIHNSDGTQFLAPVTVATTAGSLGIGSFPSAVLAGGNFVIGYQKVTSTDAAAKIYSSVGVIVGSEITVEAGAAPASGAMLACANGDWVWHYYRSAATTAHKAARYSSTGSVVVAATVLHTTASALNTSSQHVNRSILELPNGNISLVAGTNGSNQPRVITVSAALAVVNSYSTATANATPSQMVTLTLNSFGGASLVTQLVAGNLGWFHALDSSGLLVLGPTSFALATAGSNSGNMSGVLFSLGAAGYAYACCNYDGATNSVMQVVTISTLGVIKGSLVTVLSSAFSGGPTRWSVSLHPGGILHILFGDSTVNIRQAMYRTMLSSFLGVAITNGSPQIPAMIATKGSYLINQNVGAGGVVDGRTNTVPGTRAMITGPSVYMAGLV